MGIPTVTRDQGLSNTMSRAALLLVALLDIVAHLCLATDAVSSGRRRKTTAQGGATKGGGGGASNHAGPIVGGIFAGVILIAGGLCWYYKSGYCNRQRRVYTTDEAATRIQAVARGRADRNKV